MTEGQKRNKQQILSENELQSEIPKQYSEKDSSWLKCNTDLTETPSVFVLLEQMIETRAWKKIRALVECGKCMLCGEHRAPALVWV